MARVFKDGVVQVEDGASADPGIPMAGAGADLDALRTHGSSGRFQRVRFELETGAVTLTGPVVIYGETAGVIYKVGVLNDGADIVLASPGGHAEVTQFIGTYDRFGISIAGITGGGSFSAYIDGIEEGTLSIPVLSAINIEHGGVTFFARDDVPRNSQ